MTILADGRRLWRVFDNLMNNICKYAQRGTRVYLSLEAGGGPGGDLLQEHLPGAPGHPGGGAAGAVRPGRCRPGRRGQRAWASSIARSLTELQRGHAGSDGGRGPVQGGPAVRDQSFPKEVRGRRRLLPAGASRFFRRAPCAACSAMGYTTRRCNRRAAGGDAARRRRGAVSMGVLEGLEPQAGRSASLRRCAPSPTGPGTAGPSATGAWRSRGSGGWNITRTRPATSSSSRRRPPAMRRRSPSSSRATWTWSARRSPACGKDMAKEGLDLYVEDGFVRAPGHHPGRRRRHRRGHGPGRRWTTGSAAHIPGWRRCSPRRRRSACWVRWRWTPRPSGGGSCMNLDSEAEGDLHRQLRRRQHGPVRPAGEPRRPLPARRWR